MEALAWRESATVHGRSAPEMVFMSEWTALLALLLWATSSLSLRWSPWGGRRRGMKTVAVAFPFFISLFFFFFFFLLFSPFFFFFPLSPLFSFSAPEF